MHKILIIGSEALRANGVPLGRKKLDVDIICSKDAMAEVVKYYRRHHKLVVRKLEPTPAGMAVHFTNAHLDKVILDVMLTDAGDRQVYTDSSRLILEKTWDKALPVADHHKVDGLDVRHADLNTLLLLKMSHRYKKNARSFLKTMDDIHLLRRHGAIIDDPELLKIREVATYDYSHPKLNVDKKEFFKDDVPYKYDHDSIHEAVAVEDRPAYTRYMVDGEQVLTSRAKFDALPHHTKLLGVLEESYVLALERSIIPHNSSPYGAFKMALSKVCTSITSGWFREFAWEHYEEVMRLYNPDFVEKFQKALIEGRIRPFKGSVY